MHWQSPLSFLIFPDLVWSQLDPGLWSHLTSNRHLLSPDWAPHSRARRLSGRWQVTVGRHRRRRRVKTSRRSNTARHVGPLCPGEVAFNSVAKYIFFLLKPQHQDQCCHLCELNFKKDWIRFSHAFICFQDLIDNLLKIYWWSLLSAKVFGVSGMTPAQVPDRWNRIACTWTQSPAWSSRTPAAVAWGRPGRACRWWGNRSQIVKAKKSRSKASAASLLMLVLKQPKTSMLAIPKLFFNSFFCFSSAKDP